MEALTYGTLGFVSVVFIIIFYVEYRDRRMVVRPKCFVSEGSGECHDLSRWKKYMRTQNVEWRDAPSIMDNVKKFCNECAAKR
jgi:hypothetical protein